MIYILLYSYMDFIQVTSKNNNYKEITKFRPIIYFVYSWSNICNFLKPSKRCEPLIESPETNSPPQEGLLKDMLNTAFFICLEIGSGLFHKYYLLF